MTNSALERLIAEAWATNAALEVAVKRWVTIQGAPSRGTVVRFDKPEPMPEGRIA